MSRASPFPTRRPRSPSQGNGNGSQPPTTRPLQISRPTVRPTTPSNITIPPSSAYPQSGPSRPQRSELRSRQVSEYSNSELSSYRDSINTTRSDPPQSYLPRNGPSNSPITPSDSRNRFQRSKYPAEDPESSPSSAALSTVLSAFQSAGARQRSMTNGSDDAEFSRNRQRELEVEKVRQQRIKDKVPGRRMNGKARGGDIDAVLDQIKDEWEFIIDPDFNNVDLALQLLDDSSVGKDMNSFRRTKQMLSKALKGSVDKHYQAFAAALPHHTSLINHLGATQSQLNDARLSLQEAKDALGSKRADLVQLWSRGQTLEEMMRILDQIEHLKSVADVLETLISEKRLLQASILLVRSLKTINGHDMVEIGAVGDLRSYLVGQETALREILIDELQSHLYLKSFWCESRWAAYTPNQQTFSKIEFEEESASAGVGTSQHSPVSPSFRTSRLNRFLKDLGLRPNDSPHDVDDPSLQKSGLMSGLSSTSPSTGLSNLSRNSMVASESMRNPEADSFAYMEMLLESLAVLGKLGSALDTVAQRLSSEIFTLVETTLEEVGERAEYSKRGSSFVTTGPSLPGGISLLDSTADVVQGATSQGTLRSSSCLRLAALESSAKQADHEILNDFFWTVYSKLDAVSQGLRVVYEVANRIGSRRDFKDSSGAKPGALFPLAEVWMPVQAEVRSLLYDYLTDDEQGSVSGRNPISSINEILREGKFSRDKTTHVFRFADTDLKLANKTLKSHEDELTRVLKDTMPGLVQASTENAAYSLSSVASEDRLLGVGKRHRLLIRPDAFHVSVLFQPTLAFLDRITEVLPSGMETARSSTVILDDFVLKVYLPQLEEKVSLLFHQSVSGTDAFQIDPTSTRLSAEPLIKASTQLMALINSLCAMLRTTPFHRENYSRLILGVIIQFYQRCSDRFQDLVVLKTHHESDREEPLALSAQWAQKSELDPCLSELLNTSETNASKALQLCKQETHLELDFLGQKKINDVDLIPSVRNLAALASLYRSVTWFVAELNSLKATTEDFFSPTTPQNFQPNVTPYTPSLPPIIPRSSSEPLKLPLSREMALRFQALLKTYEQLAELILYTIRIDVRCRVIHHLVSSFLHGHYFVDREATEPDPNVTHLNTELGKCDDFLSGTLPKKEQRFVLAGLGLLMESMLVTNARYLSRVNAFGIKKIIRNILALQQRIKSITNGQHYTDFEQAKQYYSLFFVTPPEMLEGIRQKQAFSFDEYQTMLNLQCGVNQAEGEAGVAKATDRNYSMYVIDLHGLELENSAEDEVS